MPYQFPLIITWLIFWHVKEPGRTFNTVKKQKKERDFSRLLVRQEAVNVVS